MNEDRKTVTFLYHGEIMIFQFAIEENIFERFSKEINKDISNMCFLYNGNIIKEDFDISNIKNEIKILICDFEFEREEKESLKLSKEIICPICQELCEINFSNYKISFNNCNNNHCFPNLMINEFYDFQKIINEKKIICNQCKSNKFEAYNNKFYICCNCNINLCPLCKNSHDKNHITIDYEEKNYLCNKHGNRYILYCKENNKNLCDICEKKEYNNIYFFINFIKI